MENYIAHYQVPLLQLNAVHEVDAYICAVQLLSSTVDHRAYSSTKSFGYSLLIATEAPEAKNVFWDSPSAHASSNPK